jgi:hypothetical protein
VLAGNGPTRGRLLVLALALAASGTAWADFKRSYSEGLNAARDEKWGEVRAKMGEALSENGTPQRRMKLYGTQFVDYVPQYYIGLAAYRQGDCAEAVRQWSSPGASAIIDANAQFSGVAGPGRKDCEAKLASAAPAPKPTPAPTAPVPTPTQPIATAPTPTQPAPSPTAPRPTPTQPIATAPTPKPTPAPTPAPTAPAAPTALSEALDAFIGGRYAQAAGVDPARLPDNKAKYHAFLVRAAARYTQSQLQGSAGAPLLAQAQADIRSAKGLNASQLPDATLYSPRFRQLYTATR